MGLNPVERGLHRLRNNSKQTAKVVVHVAPGDELAVSDDVAAQLAAGDRNAFGPTPDAETPPEDDGHEGTGEAVEAISPELEEQLREDARALGIKRVGNKSPETLQREIDAIRAGDEPEG